MNISELKAELPSQYQRLREAKRAVGDHIAWYPYDSLEVVFALDKTLHGENRDLTRLAGGMPVADIGGGDGDLAFALEDAAGFEIEYIDTAGPNMNQMAGVRALHAYLKSRIKIHDIDLDSQFRLPSERYGLVFVLGLLYHLQNPFFVLQELSRRAHYCVLSTRVARFGGPEHIPIGTLPVAYLVSPVETNNDASNYWIFSPVGLQRIIERTGWVVVEHASFGDLKDSDPASPEHDERAVMLLRSTAIERASGITSDATAHRRLWRLPRASRSRNS